MLAACVLFFVGYPVAVGGAIQNATQVLQDWSVGVNGSSGSRQRSSKRVKLYCVGFREWLEQGTDCKCIVLFSLWNLLPQFMWFASAVERDESWSLDALLVCVCVCVCVCVFQLVHVLRFSFGSVL